MNYCPYTVDRHLIQQTTYEYDENGNVSRSSSTIPLNSWSAKNPNVLHGDFRDASTANHNKKC